MATSFAIQCQYRMGQQQCRNRTSSPRGLCPKHVNSMPLRDINAGTGKPPLMTAIPRVGGIMNSTLPQSAPQPRNNQEMVAQLLELEREERQSGGGESSGGLWGSMRRGFSQLSGRAQDSESQPGPTKQEKAWLNEEREALRGRLARIPHGPERERRVATEIARTEKSLRSRGGDHLIPQGGLRP